MGSVYWFTIRLLAVSITGLVVSCYQNRGKMNEQTMNNSTPDTLYHEGFVHANGIKLHYMDWGGTGQPLVMVHAWGDTPYLFLNLASALSSNFRVITYSGRGHGKSEIPDWGYDIPTLTEDLKQLLDTLSIDRVSLLGMSSAGNEITAFTTQYPERVRRLIYLEAGYDIGHALGAEALSTLPGNVIPDQDALSSLDSYRAWYHNFWFADVPWNELLEKNLRAHTQVMTDGTIQTMPNTQILGALLQSHKNYHRDYRNVKAPVLALFASEFMLTSSHDSAMVNAYSLWNIEKVKPWKEHSITKLKTELYNVRIKEIPETCHMSIAFKKTPLLAEVIAEFVLKDTQSQ
jgi:pimeloyl-ACP methyl ester carboxylesterase